MKTQRPAPKRPDIPIPDPPRTPPASALDEERAYCLVDSVSAISDLHRLLGGKPGQGFLPEWPNLTKFVQERYPNMNWRFIFFMALPKGQADTTGSFAAYLKAVGFRVVELQVTQQSWAPEESAKEKEKITGEALAKMLDTLRSAASAPVLLLSHNTGLIETLQEMHQADPERILGIVGFPELLPEPLGLLVFDLEYDIKAFKKALPRRQVLTPESFDPSQYL